MKVQSDDDQSSIAEENYSESKSRWFHFVLYLCALCSNLVFGFAISPIAKELAIIYDIDDRFISTLVVSFTLFSAIMIIPGNIINEKYGIATSIKLGCLLTLIGAMTSLLVNVSFWFLYLGELISLIGFPFRLICASQFAANWFFPKNRVLITIAIALTFNTCSGLAIRIPLLVFGDYEANENTIDQGRDLVFQLMSFLAILIAALTVPTLLFFRSKPKHPPSFSASDACVRENYGKAAKHLMQNRDFLLLALSFSLILGPVVLLTVQMEYVVKPYGYSLSDISNIIGVGVLAGLMGDCIVGGTAKYLQKYKIVMQFCNAITTFFYGCLICTLWLDLKVLFFISYFLVCLSSSVMAITFEFSCELSFPVTETSTISFLGLAGNGLNFIQAIPETLILGLNTSESSTITLIIMFSLSLSGNFICRLIDEKLRRSKVDNKHDTKQNLIVSESESDF